MSKTVPLLVLVAAAPYLTLSTLRDAPSSVAFKIPIVTIHAKEFAFVGPLSIASGQTTFRLVNDGREVHHLTIYKLSRGKTVADVRSSMKSDVPPPWLTAVGGTNAALPRDTMEATLTLEPGNYALLCILASPGEEIRHTTKGMAVPLTVSAPGGVTQAGAAFVPTPVPDIHLELKDYGFVLSKPITAGKHTIHVMNDGPQDHEAVMLKMAPGKRLADFFAWALSRSTGPSPARFINGVATMAKGRTAVFSDDFVPGAYAITCFVSAPDKMPHLAHGMSMEFEVK